MKRCPSCKFIYLDTDEVCDFDGAKLVLVDETVLESCVATEPVTSLAQPPETGRSNRPVAVGAVVGFVIAVVMFLVYFGPASRSKSVAQSVLPPLQVAPSVQPTPLPILTASPSPSVEPSRDVTERHGDSPPPTTATRANVSKNPVSTTTRNGSQAGALIKLNNGARIEADEVWRTKEGVWYRRNGLVTLLKASQVKAIEKSSRNQ